MTSWKVDISRLDGLVARSGLLHRQTRQATPLTCQARSGLAHAKAGHEECAAWGLERLVATSDMAK
jgi:hypothetical protein